MATKRLARDSLQKMSPSWWWTATGWGVNLNSIYLILSDDNKLDVVFDIELVVQQYGKGCLLPKRESLSAKSSSSLPMSIFSRGLSKDTKMHD